jgi:hypothetical protein
VKKKRFSVEQIAAARNDIWSHAPETWRRLDPAGTDDASRRVAWQAFDAGQHTRDVTIMSSRA